MSVQATTMQTTSRYKGTLDGWCREIDRALDHGCPSCGSTLPFLRRYSFRNKEPWAQLYCEACEFPVWDNVDGWAPELSHIVNPPSRLVRAVALTVACLFVTVCAAANGVLIAAM